jgi:hypothetical protein
MPTEFEIVAPVRHQTASIAPDGTIAVTLHDFAGDTYSVSIYFFPFGAGGSKVPDGSSITLPIVSGSYSTTMPINTSNLGPGFNRYIEVTDNNTFDVQGFSFRAVISGSGSGSLPIIPPTLSSLQMSGKVVPQAMTLKLDTKVTAGTCAKCADLNKPALLLHADDAKLANCWLSRPIAFCGKGKPPGHWVLKRKNATVWTLELKQESKTHVTYTAKVKAKDYTLPLKLARSGSGSKVCKAWPKSITITVAS